MRSVSAMKSFIIILFCFSTCYCETEFSGRLRNFSIELLHFTQLETEGHVVISPFGIWTLMIGVEFGVSGNSYKEIKRSFILPNTEKTLINEYKNLTNTVLDLTTNGATLTSKHFVFLDNNFSINPNFRSSVTNDFQASIKVLDFKDIDAAAKFANKIIQNFGAIVAIVLKSEDFFESRMILTNAISFKGLWSLPFNKSETRVEPFYNENKEVIGEVDMMYQEDAFPYSNIRKLKSFAVELPYGNDNKFSMFILLPHPNVRIANMYMNFQKISLKDILTQLEKDVDEFGLQDVDLKLPRFKISTNVVLNKPLNNMGVYDIFDPQFANFRQVSDEGIYVSRIVHKADIEVTESGTVASASTSPNFADRISRPSFVAKDIEVTESGTVASASTSANFADRISTPSFVANRPFIYFVMEKTTASVICGGIYSKPFIY